jgi:hypothetical protein
MLFSSSMLLVGWWGMAAGNNGLRRPRPPFRGWGGVGVPHLVAASGWPADSCFEGISPNREINFVTGLPDANSSAWFAHRNVSSVRWAYGPDSPFAVKNNDSATTAYFKTACAPESPAGPMPDFCPPHADQPPWCLPGTQPAHHWAGCSYDEWLGSDRAKQLAARGIRQARAAWPANFIGVWGHTPDEHIVSLMADGAIDLYLLEGYTYCPGCPGCCTGDNVKAYFPQLDVARQHGFINRTVVALGWMLGRSKLNPGGWTPASLRASMVLLKYKYPEMPGMFIYGWPPGNGTISSHRPDYRDTATIALMKAAAGLLKELYPDASGSYGSRDRPTPPSEFHNGQALNQDNVETAGRSPRNQGASTPPGAVPGGLTTNDTTHRWDLATSWNDIVTPDRLRADGGRNDMICQGGVMDNMSCPTSCPCPSLSATPVFPGGRGATQFKTWTRGAGLHTQRPVTITRERAYTLWWKATMLPRAELVRQDIIFGGTCDYLGTLNDCAIYVAFWNASKPGCHRTAPPYIPHCGPLLTFVFSRNNSQWLQFCTNPMNFSVTPHEPHFLGFSSSGIDQSSFRFVYDGVDRTSELYLCSQGSGSHAEKDPSGLQMNLRVGVQGGARCSTNGAACDSFEGYVGGVRWFNRSLSSAELVSIYREEVAK